MHEAATALGHSFIESTDICDHFKTLKLLYILYSEKFLNKAAYLNLFSPVYTQKQA